MFQHHQPETKFTFGPRPKPDGPSVPESPRHEVERPSILDSDDSSYGPGGFAFIPFTSRLTSPRKIRSNTQEVKTPARDTPRRELFPADNSAVAPRPRTLVLPVPLPNPIPIIRPVPLPDVVSLPDPKPIHVISAAPNSDPEPIIAPAHSGCGRSPNTRACSLKGLLAAVLALVIMGVMWHEMKLAYAESVEFDMLCLSLRHNETERTDFHVVVSSEIDLHNKMTEFMMDRRDSEVCEDNTKAGDTLSPDERAKLVIDKQDKQRECMEKEREDIYALAKSRIKETSADVKTRIEENNRQGIKGLGRSLDMVMSKARTTWGKKLQEETTALREEVHAKYVKMSIVTRLREVTRALADFFDLFPEVFPVGLRIA